MAQKSDFLEMLEVAKKRFEDILQKTPFELKAIQREIDYLKRRETEKTLTDLPLPAWDVIRKHLDTSEETLFHLCMASPLIHQIISMKRGKSPHQTLRFTGDKVIGILTQNVYLDKADLENLSKTKTELAICATPNLPFLSHAKGSTVRVRDTARQTERDQLYNPVGLEGTLSYLRTKVSSEPVFFSQSFIINAKPPQWFNNDNGDENHFWYWNTIDYFMKEYGKHLTYIELIMSEIPIAYQVVERLAWRNFSLLPRLQSLIIVSNGVRNEVVAEIDERTRSTSFRLISDLCCPHQNKLLQVLLPEVTRWLILKPTFTLRFEALFNHETTAQWKLKEIALQPQNNSDFTFTQFINYFAASGILEKIVSLRVFDGARLFTSNFCAAFASLRELEIDEYDGELETTESKGIPSGNLKLPSLLKLTITPLCAGTLPLDVISEMFPNLQTLVLKSFLNREEFKAAIPPVLLDKVDVLRLYKHDQSLTNSNSWEMFTKLRVLSVQTKYKFINNGDEYYFIVSTETYSRSPNGNVNFKATSVRDIEFRKYEDDFMVQI